MPKVSIEWNGSVFVLLQKDQTNGTTVYKYSRDGTTWESGDAPASSATLDATVAKWTGDRLFVGGESSGNNIIITSKDGIHYSVSKTANGIQLHGLETNLEYRNTIVFPRTVYLAVGGVSGETYRMAYSLDNSESWTPISGVSANDAVWNGRMWVAGGTQVATSSDGIHWINRGAIFSNSVSAVSWSKELHLWVVVGNDASGNNVAYSIDGVHWLTANIPGFVYGNTVGWNGDIWVAGGSSNDGRTIATSLDGKTWTSTTGGITASESTRVEWDGAQWTMFGNYGCATSANGLQWHVSSARQPTPLYTDLFFLQESSGNTYSRSLDGANWESRSTVVDMSLSVIDRFSRNISNEAVAHIQPITIATGEGINTMAYSADGIYWTGLGTSVFTTRANRAVWNGRLWVAVGAGGFWVATSYDGLIWTGRDSTLLSEGYDVAWNGERFIVAGEEGMTYSVDGIHWQSVGGEVKATSVVWTGRVWMVYTANGRATSSDGLTWTTEIVDIADRQIPVVLRNSVLVDVSNGSGTFSNLFGNIIESQTVDLNRNPTAVCFDGETTFVADASGNIAYLTNDAAISPTSKLFQSGTIDSRLSSIYSACWNQQFVLFAGTGGITYGRTGTAWQHTNAGQLFSIVRGVASNSGYGFVHVPNAVYLHTNDILRVVGPKAYTFPGETAVHFNVRPMDL